MRCVYKETPPYCKPAFVNSVAYDERNKMFGVCTTDGQLHFYTKGKMQIEYRSSIRTIESHRNPKPSIQSRIFYLPKHALWLTAGMDFMMRVWDTQKTARDCLLGDPLKLHRDEITDCVELANPRCIITCSMDRTIVFYDMNARQRLNKIDAGKHEMGIRHLRIQSVKAPQMVSIGNELYANVWTPESVSKRKDLVSDIWVGQLKGHKRRIIDGHYLGKAPYFATIEETSTVFVWDIMNLTCIQTIALNFNMFPEGLVVLSNNVFWACGKRFFQFDTFMDESNDEEGQNSKSAAATNYPISAAINDYLFSLFVVNKKEVRMYDISNGNLMALHGNIFEQMTVNGEITVFRIDKRHRKAYIANN
jgi:WD40 repeat protein